MRMDKLTTNFQLALQEAQSMAVGQDHQFIEPVHLMLAMLNQENSVVASLYLSAGADVNVIKEKSQEIVGRLPRVSGTAGEVHISNSLSNLLNVTDKLAQQTGDDYIASEMFAVAAIEDKGDLGSLLKQSGLNRQQLMHLNLVIIVFLFLIPSGTSPFTIRNASPSTIAVLPTPGSPISTGLFFVRRCNT